MDDNNLNYQFEMTSDLYFKKIKPHRHIENIALYYVTMWF
jgi:hypothetical protein